MYPLLNISLLPIDIAHADWQANISTAASEIASLQVSTDIAVLPELFSTGFVRPHDRAAQIAQDAWPLAIGMLREQADANDCAVAGSMMYSDESTDRIYNRAFFIEPHGESYFYDKRHLFALGAESEVFSAGHSQSPIIHFRGWNIALAVCYDMRFPAWVRNTGLKYDLLIVPANWPEARSFAWTHLLQARAIENQAYVAGVNRSGEDKMGCYTGQTYLCDYTGQYVSCSRHGMSLQAEISKSEMDEFREKFPFWKDADRISL